MRPLAIIGPTGTGKSALALAVAERVGGRDRERRRDAALPRDGHRDREASRRRTPRNSPSPARRAGRHRDRDRRALPARRRRGRRAITAAGRGADHRRRLDAVHPVAARRLGVPGHRPGGAGQVGAAAGRGRRRRAARGAGRCRLGRGRVDPGHRRPAHRAGAGGRRAHRTAVRGVGADHRCAALGHRDHRIGLGDSRSRRATGEAHRHDVRRRSRRRGASRCWAGVCATA